MPNLSGAPQSQQQPPEYMSAHFGGPALLFGAYLFFYSWLLLFNYYSTFGISLVSLDMPVYFYLTFASTAVEYFGIWLLVALALGAFFYVLLNSAWPWDRKPWVLMLHKFLFAVLLAIGFWVTSFMAQQQGQLQAQQVRDGGVLPAIRLVFEKDRGELFPNILKAAKQTADSGVEEAVLLVETKSVYYVLVQKVLRDRQSAQTRYDSMGVVYRVPKKYVSYAEVDVANTERLEGYFARFADWGTLLDPAKLKEAGWPGY